MTYDDFVRRASHAEVLISQGRYQQAEDILKNLIATGIEEQDIWRMMIVTWMGLGYYKSARDLCKTSLHRYPYDAWVLYSMANIDIAEQKYDEAVENINKALQMEPESDTFHTLKSSLLVRLKDYENALNSAETALELNSENVDALNNRSEALMGLGRKEEAFVNLEYALETDPENSDTHANMGWYLLHKGKHKEALTHFKESLQKQPLNQYAISGMQEAMKAKFPAYRYILMISLYLQKLKSQQQWGFIIGSYIFYRVLVYLAKQYEFLQVFIFPVIFLLIFYFLSSWILSPLMNLYLMTHTFGKLTLSEVQKESARYTGMALGLSMFSLLLYFVMSDNGGWLHLALVAFLLMIPLGSMNNAEHSLITKKLRFFTVALTLIGLSSSMVALLNQEFLHLSIWPFIIGSFGYQWYANYLMMRE